MNNDELQAEVDDFVKHVGAPSFKEAVDVLLRTKQQDEDKISEMFEIIKSTGVTNSKLAAEIAELKEQVTYLKAAGEGLQMTIRTEREIRDTLRAELEAQKQWRNEAEGKLIECGREIANHVTELEAANAREEFLKSKGLTVGMLTESGKEPHLAYVIEPESELCDLRYIHENLDLKRELEAARKERDQWREQHDTADRSHFRVLQQRDTALAAKDAAEKALNRAFWVMEAQAEAEEPIGSAEFWQAEAGKIAAVLPAALTPAPTQEPPAGGVTISNDSSGVEGHAGEQKCDDPTLLNPKPSTSGFQRAEMPSNARRSVTEPSENQASPAITPSNSPANVQPEGRGELLPFNLSDALAGKPVVTRDGREANGFRRRPNVHFSGYDYEVEVDNVWRSYKSDGRWMGKTDSIFDLFMLPSEGSGA